jgi:penicillin amidase
MSAAAVAVDPPPPVAAPRRRRRILLPLLGTAAGGLVLIALLACAFYWHWSRKALPQVDGEATLPGLTAPVTVRRDALGVPHLSGASVLDAVRAQGYVTAQDRLWQMDLMRRRALGELSEAFGEGALRADKEIRTLGLGDAARRTLALVPPHLREELDAYAAGVNAYIEGHRDALPLEFRLLQYGPRPWEPRDTVAVGKLLAMDLAQGWEGEAFRATVGDRLPPDVQELLFPTLFAQDRILFGHDRAPNTGARASAALEADVSLGSNNWVVAGTRTATGLPLLANDPHLGLGIPSIWTAVHLTAPGLDVAGVTLPGVPGVILGRNADVAWGCTNVHDDGADLYVEEFDPRDPDRYRSGEGWEKVTVRRESIRVRDGALSSSFRTVEHPVRLTRHGPLIEIRGRLYALRWTALEDAVELSAFAGAGRARGWDEFQKALSLYPGPSQNFVYADRTGHIAWYSAGKLPIRRAQDGSRPYAGASPDGDWTGYVPFEELPHVVDPPSGVIVTANNRLVGTDYPHRVTRGGVGPWRAAALLESLEARTGWTADDIARLQGERLSIPHRDLARELLEAAARHPGDAGWRAVEETMRGWDGRMEAGSRPAAMAFATFRALGERAIGGRLGNVPFAKSLSRRMAAVHRLVLERPAAWVPPADGDWDGLLLASWREAGTQIAETLGDDRARWTWGAMNRMAVVHPLAGAFRPLGALLSPPEVQIGGSATTPNVLATTPSGAIEAPSMRFIADMADPDNTRLVNFMGQSGHPASPHYGDQFEPWVKVESRKLPFTAAAVAREARHTLTLKP